MSIGENIKRIRQSTNVTQKQLGELVGVDQSMICQIERGTKTPNMALWKQIADVFGCSVEKFYEDEKTPAEKQA